MKKIDHDGLILCDMQGVVFELSLSRYSCSSDIFIRRFANSSIVEIFDNGAILDDCYTENAVLEDMKNQYGELSYGNNKYDKEVMYWMGYLYRYFCYTYDIDMKKAYKLIPPRELAQLYFGYHTLDCSNAIERILESKNITFDKKDYTKLGVQILKQLRS